MTKFVLVAAMAMAAIGTAPRALACVCIEAGSTGDQLDAAETVVLGRVVGLAIRTKQVEGETVEYTAATVRVGRRWKGSQAKRVTVNTCGDAVRVCTCGVRFELGGTYIVVTEEGGPATSCGLTRAALPSGDPLVAEIDAHFGE